MERVVAVPQYAPWKNLPQEYELQNDGEVDTNDTLSNYNRSYGTVQEALCDEKLKIAPTLHALHVDAGRASTGEDFGVLHGFSNDERMGADDAPVLSPHLHDDFTGCAFFSIASMFQRRCRPDAVNDVETISCTGPSACEELGERSHQSPSVVLSWSLGGTLTGRSNAAPSDDAKMTKASVPRLPLPLKGSRANVSRPVEQRRPHVQWAPQSYLRLNKERQKSSSSWDATAAEQEHISSKAPPQPPPMGSVGSVLEPQMGLPLPLPYPLLEQPPHPGKDSSQVPFCRPPDHDSFDQEVPSISESEDEYQRSESKTTGSQSARRTESKTEIEEATVGVSIGHSSVHGNDTSILQQPPQTITEVDCRTQCSCGGRLQMQRCIHTKCGSGVQRLIQTLVTSCTGTRQSSEQPSSTDGNSDAAGAVAAIADWQRRLATLENHSQQSNPREGDFRESARESKGKGKAKEREKGKGKGRGKGKRKGKKANDDSSESESRSDGYEIIEV